MLGSRIINKQQHVGLQKLCTLAEVSHSFLGPHKSYKFIQDDSTGESALVGSCFRIFENLELTCAVGQLVNQTVEAHHRVYRSGCGCLLFLCGAWARAALECLRRGIPLGSVVSALSGGMEICLDVCKKSSISVESVRDSVPASATAKASSGRGAGLKALKLSRHFCDGSEAAEEAERPDLRRVAEGLAHGCVEAMDLVVRAAQMQSENVSRFDASKLASCALPGSPGDRPCVLKGCVVLLSAEQSSVARHLQGRRLKVALISGDLADAYRHLGFKSHPGCRRVRDQPGPWGPTREEEWLETVETLLSTLEVNLILVSGRVGDGVLPRFCRRRILVVEKVKVSVLKAVAEATGAVPVSYATQLNRLCVGIGAKVAAWREAAQADGGPRSAVVVSAEGSGGPVTAVLTGCVPARLQVMEDGFWACAYRLHHALRDGVLLPGAGVTEMLCARHLLLDGSGEADPCRGVVFGLMAEGFADYVATAMVNTGRFSKVGARTELSRVLNDHGEGGDVAGAMTRLLSDAEDARGDPAAVKPDHPPSRKIYDGASAKQEAWRRALDLVLLVLQADAEVVTGTDQEPGGSQETLMLL